MGIKVLFTYDYGDNNMKKVKELGYDLIMLNEKHIIYNEKLNDVEVMSCYNPFKTLEISKMKKLKWIQLSSVGIDQLPVEYISKSNIIVTNNRGGYSIPMGEWIVLKILELLKNSKKLYEKQANKVWKMDKSILELCGKTIGFIGTGSIATEGAKRLKGFDATIIGLNTNGRETNYFDKCFSSNNINEFLQESDVIVVTIPYTKKTHHLLNKEKFKVMKEGAYLINVARGAIIDESALIDNLLNGKLRGAALDVVEKEPLDINSELWNMENVIVTPHNSWISDKCDLRRFKLIYDNLSCYINGKGLNNIVNLKEGY